MAAPHTAIKILLPRFTGIRFLVYIARVNIFRMILMPPFCSQNPDNLPVFNFQMVIPIFWSMHLSRPLEIEKKAIAIFGDLFSEKLFRAQLSYFDDVDYTEEVEYLVATPPPNEEIKATLTQIALDGVM